MTDWRRRLAFCTLSGMADVLTAVLLSVPWLLAVIWMCRRGGLRLLLGDGKAFPSQADELRAFGSR